MTADLSAAQARRIFLAAQGLATRRPRGAVTPRQFRAYVERQGVLQLDSVNVFARAHYMPLFSRFGPYSQERLDEFLWGAPHGHSAHAFEHWGHEASVMPLDLLPAMHHRMVSSEGWKTEARERLDRERPGLLGQLQEEVEASGPLTAGQLEHLAPRTGPKGTWWDLGDAKTGLEYLFFTGGVAASRGRHFTRTYDGAERAWGLVPAPEGTWGLPPSAAEQVLFDRGLAATGVGLPQDIADHFRLFSKGGSRAARAQACAQSAVERGLAQWVDVEGWDQPAVLSASAQDPGRATGAALLSPFDPVCWYRPRLERMFGVEYRIEIYTPAAKRQYGYYCLPFLLGDDVVARVDLKADRKAGRLLVQAAWREPRTAPGARRRPDAVVASALAAELGVAAQWLSLGEIVVQPRGDLSAELAAAVAT